MPYYSDISEIPGDDEGYKNNCVDGKCANCGECCSDLLPLTKLELERIKRYAQKRHLKEHRQAPFWDRNATDFTCPFRNQQTKRCEIYPARPEICRSFICSKPVAVAYEERDRIHESRQVYSLRNEVFGNPECNDYIAAVCAMKVGMI